MKTDPTPLLLPFARAYWPRLVAIVCAIFVSSSSVLTFGWGLKNLVDGGFHAEGGAALDRALLLLLAIVSATAMASYTRVHSAFWVAERTVAELRRRAFRALLSADAAWLEARTAGDLISRVTTDTALLQTTLSTTFPIALRHLLTLLGGITMLFVVSPGLTALVLLVVPVVVGPLVFFGRRVRARSKEAQARLGALSAFGQEALHALQTVQSFNAEARTADAFGARANASFEAAMYYARLRAGLTATAIFIVFAALSAVLWAGGHRVASGQMSAGELSAFVFYAVMVAGAVTSVSDSFGALAQAAGALDRLAEITGLRPRAAGTALPSLPARGDVTFENVSFRYPSRPDRWALRAVSFTVQAGETVAVVGASGAGKSTLFQLLQLFHAPEEGIIRLDGQDIAQLDPSALRRLIGSVPQDPAIFSETLAENIRIGNPDATDDALRAAAVRARADDFIDVLPEGYHTLAGERGGRLSGGQRQRIAIARAVLKDAPVLLLDEATSALDARNEQAVHAALRELMQGRTTLIIAHRLSTVRDADRVILLDQGRMIAQGPPAEMLARREVAACLLAD
jgi:ATP-binding cassette, subfamily B, bacterial